MNVVLFEIVLVACVVCSGFSFGSIRGFEYATFVAVWTMCIGDKPSARDARMIDWLYDTKAYFSTN